MATRIARFRRRQAAQARSARSSPPPIVTALPEADALLAVAPLEPVIEETPPPVVVEPRRRTGSKDNLVWQETFDFGKGGAESFQLPPLGLLQQAPVDQKSTVSDEHFQDN